MKAILVFDVDELTYEAINDYFTGVIDLLLGNDKLICFEDVMLKPMPQKKEVKGDFYKQREIATEMNDLIDFDKGYNKCIDEILSCGEKNDRK